MRVQLLRDHLQLSLNRISPSMLLDLSRSPLCHLFLNCQDFAASSFKTTELLFTNLLRSTYAFLLAIPALFLSKLNSSFATPEERRSQSNTILLSEPMNF